MPYPLGDRVLALHALASRIGYSVILYDKLIFIQTHTQQGDSPESIAATELSDTHFSRAPNSLSAHFIDFPVRIMQ